MSLTGDLRNESVCLRVFLPGASSFLEITIHEFNLPTERDYLIAHRHVVNYTKKFKIQERDEFSDEHTIIKKGIRGVVII